jgi:uncharacterized protein YjbJ (UPF0337 family)
MVDDILAGMWNQIKGSVKQYWGDLTDDDLLEIEGRRDRLTGKLQERYGYSKMEAEAEIDEFLRETEAKMKSGF